MDQARNIEINHLIGERIKRYRKALGYTQTALADQLGVTFQQIQKYENGTNRVSAACLVEIAAALHLPIQSFVPDTSFQRNSDVSFPNSDDNFHTQRLLAAYHKISDAELRTSVVVFVERMAR